jgi:exosome complex component RRP4
VPRLKTHFCPLAAHGVELLLGCNGWVWVALRSSRELESAATTDQAAAAEAASAARPDEAPEAWAEAADAPVACEERERLTRAAAAVRLLARIGRLITPVAVAEVADAALAWAVLPADMLSSAFVQRLQSRFAADAGD